MDNIKESFHGSDLEVIAEKYHMEQNSIIPYASNVNPLGMSPMAKEALMANIEAIQTYPDRDYSHLRNTVANDINIPVKSTATFTFCGIKSKPDFSLSSNQAMVVKAQ